LGAGHHPFEEKIALHRYLKEKMGFPFYYGGNLDALFDELSSVTEPTQITLTYSTRPKGKMATYAPAAACVRGRVAHQLQPQADRTRCGLSAGRLQTQEVEQAKAPFHFFVLQAFHRIAAAFHRAADSVGAQHSRGKCRADPEAVKGVYPWKPARGIFSLDTLCLSVWFLLWQPCSVEPHSNGCGNKREACYRGFTVCAGRFFCGGAVFAVELVRLGGHAAAQRGVPGDGKPEKADLRPQRAVFAVHKTDQLHCCLVDGAVRAEIGILYVYL
jgi:RNAse (barnase) inhibitor barstar